MWRRKLKHFLYWGTGLPWTESTKSELRRIKHISGKKNLSQQPRNWVAEKIVRLEYSTEGGERDYMEVEHALIIHENYLYM